MKILLLLVLFSTSLYAQGRHSPPFEMLASLGAITGIEPVSITGLNPDIDAASTPETIWSGGGILSVKYAGEATTIVSSSSADADGGTGLQKVAISGVDGNWQRISEIATLNGTTPVTLTGEYMRINSAIGTLGGTSMSNTGAIDIKHGATIIAEIQAGESKAEQMLYSVPAGHTLLMDNISSSLNKKGSGTVTLEFQIQAFGTSVWYDAFPVGLDGAGNSVVQIFPGQNGRYFRLPEKTTIRARAFSASSNDNEVTASMAGFLVNNSTFKF